MTRTPPAARDGARTRRSRGPHGGPSTPNRVERRARTHRAESTETTDSFQLFLNQAARYPLLTAEEEIELAQRIERGSFAEPSQRREVTKRKPVRDYLSEPIDYLSDWEV